MAAFITRAFLWIIFGLIASDIINEFKVFDIPVRWYAVMGPVMLLFGLQEAFLKRLEIKRKSLTDTEIQESKAFKFFYILVWVIVTFLLIGIPIVWWGAIKKTISDAN